jgi:hypothetical protein
MEQPSTSRSSRSTDYTVYLTLDAKPITDQKTPSFSTTRSYLQAHVPYFTTYFNSNFTSTSVSYLDGNVIAPAALEHILARPPLALPATPTAVDALNLAIAADYLLITPLYEACLTYLRSLTNPNDLAVSLRLICTEIKFRGVHEILYLPQLRALAAKSPRLWKRPILLLPSEVGQDLLVQIGRHFQNNNTKAIVATWKDVCELRRVVNKVNREQIWNETILNDIQSVCERALLESFPTGLAVIRDMLQEDGVGGEVGELLNHALAGREMRGQEQVWVGVRKLLEPWSGEDGRVIAKTLVYQRAVKEAQRRLKSWWTKPRIDREFLEDGFTFWDVDALRDFERAMGLNEGDLQLKDARNQAGMRGTPRGEKKQP